MAFAVLLTEGAERDLEDIYRYIAASDSVGDADRVLDALETAALSLSELPERGNVPKELRSLERDRPFLNRKRIPLGRDV